MNMNDETILRHLGFAESHEKPGLWYLEESKDSVAFVDFRTEDGRRYARRGGVMVEGDRIPILQKVKELRAQAQRTGKLLPEVEGTAQPTATGPQAPAQPQAQGQPQTQPETEFYVPVNVGGMWTKQPATAEDYKAVEERVLGHNLAMLKRCAALVHGEALPVISNEKAVELLYNSVAKHAHFEFERAITKRAMEAKRVNGK